MPREWSRKSAQDRKRAASEAIFGLLPIDGSELQWSKLKEHASTQGISSATLASHLKQLVKAGLAKRRVDPSAYPPRVYYSRKAYGARQVDLASTRQARRLAKLHEMGLDVEKYVWANVKNTLAALVGDIPVAFREALDITDALDAWRYREQGIKGYEEEKFPFRPRNRIEAHRVLDEILDVYFRPLAHGLMEFVYTPDPRNGKPVIYNRAIWKELVDLEAISMQMEEPGQIVDTYSKKLLELRRRESRR